MGHARWPSIELRSPANFFFEPATGMPKWETVVPKAWRWFELEAMHGPPGVVHFGVNKTLMQVRQEFCWSTCRRDVESYCQRCEKCTVKIGPTVQFHASLQQDQVGHSMDHAAVDVLGPFP